MKKVSVVMPVLNGMPFIKRALNSIIGQSLTDIEIIVVDAGSGDGTLEFVTECMNKDNRIKLVNSDKKSHGAQCNLGIARALGKYIAFCESDDYMDESMLYNLYEVAEKNGFPDCVKSNFYLFINKGEEEFSLPYDVLPEKKKALYGKVISIDDYPGIVMRDVNMWNGIFLQEFIRNSGILLNETPGASFQDIGFVQQVNLMARRQVYIPEDYYHYRQDNAGSSVYRKERSRFAMQECLYAMNWIGLHEDIKVRYGYLAISRMLNMFVQLYAEDKYKHGCITYDDNLCDFQNTVLTFIHSFNLPGRSLLEANTLVWLFLNDLEQFKIISGTIRKKEVCSIATFRDSIELCNEIVIVTTGDIGMAIYALLVRNNWHGDVVFCDNDKRKQGMEIMGISVLSVEQAAENHPEALFVVNPNMYGDLSEQLVSNGVYNDRIVLAPFVFPHTCMEIDFIDYGAEKDDRRK